MMKMKISWRSDVISKNRNLKLCGSDLQISNCFNYKRIFGFRKKRRKERERGEKVETMETKRREIGKEGEKNYTTKK